jgi:hypothetical protein
MIETGSSVQTFFAILLALATCTAMLPAPM